MVIVVTVRVGVKRPLHLLTLIDNFTKPRHKRVVSIPSFYLEGKEETRRPSLSPTNMKADADNSTVTAVLSEY